MSENIPKYGDVITEEGKATLEFHVFLEDIARDIELAETTQPEADERLMRFLIG